MLDNIDDKKLEPKSIQTPTRLIDTHDPIDLHLAHELAHCLREHDTEKFIFIYDFKVPDTFDPSRVSSPLIKTQANRATKSNLTFFCQIDRLKENSRILSELHPTEFAKVCDDLKCDMDQNRIVKNEEYFRQKSAAASTDTIKFENEALAKQFLDDSDAATDAFNLPKLSGHGSSMCRDGFVTNLRYQTYKDNKRNETQLTSCYDEVYAVKSQSDDLDSDEKLSSSASSSISYRSTKHDHVIINMSNDDDDHQFGSFENKYKQQDDYLEALKNECKVGTSLKSGREDAARSHVAYQLMAQSQMDRSKLNRSDQMRGDFSKACDEESDSAPNLDSSQFLLSHVLSKLVEKNKPDKASPLQFNNYKFEEKCEGKIGNEGCRLACKSDHLDSHGSSMTNSSKHEDDDEEKDDEYEMDFDQYFPHKTERKNDQDQGLKKTIEELSTRHVAESKKSLGRNESTEMSKACAVKNAPPSAGFHQKYQNCAYFLNCPNPELQQNNKTTEEKSTPIDNKSKLAPNAKKSQKKASNNQNDSKKNSMYSKHWIEDVDSLLEFITSTSIKSEQKPNKSKKQNTETSNPSNNNNNNNNCNNINNKNLSKKNKKSESECKQKPISAEDSEITEPTQFDAVSIESPPTKINDSNILPQIEQPNIDIHQDLPETEFVTVIKGKKVKKEAKESKELFENSKSENLVSSQSASKKIKQNKSIEKHNFTPRRDSVEKKPSVKNIEAKSDPQTTSINQEPKEEKSTEILEKIETSETKSSSPVFQTSHTNHKESTLKKSASISSKKTPVVFLDEILMKKSSSFSLPLDIKFGLSTDEEQTVQAEELIDPKTNNSDTDQTILVKKKTKQKRNKSTRTASKRLDLIQNHHSSDSSLNPLTSCDETETSKNITLKKKKSLRKKQADTAPQSTVNSQETEQSSSGPSFQGYYTQPFANQYQPYIIYQIDPNTNLPVALIPVNAFNIAGQVNTDATSPLGSQYYTALDLNAYNYQLANYQYMQQFGQNYQANMVPMAYSVFVPPSGPTESQSQVNVQQESQAQIPVENASDNSRTNSRDYYQNGAIAQTNYNLPLNYMHNHYPGHHASYPSFSNLNNGYMHRSSSLSNRHSGPAGELNPSQCVQNENSNLLNKNVAGSNVKLKNPRHPNSAF
ncbi:hypothetical protein BpHYR1_012095 [Brachionus plicatilis]|uniref:Uncharacterized protein n=1 Tax=Brachionus plicatilis TaxID=10195 RepID=A0A3M7R315_BRAPC|nr:hypothetical protein BpHYR1_012095 [Brachionus plicatilis]